MSHENIQTTRIPVGVYDIITELQGRQKAVELALTVLTGRAPGSDDRSELKAANEALGKQSATVAALSNRIKELTDQLWECQQKLGLAMARCTGDRMPLCVYGIDWPTHVTTDGMGRLTPTAK